MIASGTYSTSTPLLSKCNERKVHEFRCYRVTDLDKAVDVPYSISSCVDCLPILCKVVTAWGPVKTVFPLGSGVQLDHSVRYLFPLAVSQTGGMIMYDSATVATGRSAVS